MAYDREEIYNQALQLSQTEGYFFVQDVVASLCVSNSTFYDYFPDKSDELDTIKANLYKNKINEKLKIRKSLASGDGGGTGLIAYYKLICDDEERKSLSTNWNENNHKGNISINPKEWVD